MDFLPPASLRSSRSSFPTPCSASTPRIASGEGASPAFSVSLFIPYFAWRARLLNWVGKSAAPSPAPCRPNRACFPPTPPNPVQPPPYLTAALSVLRACCFPVRRCPIARLGLVESSRRSLSISFGTPSRCAPGCFSPWRWLCGSPMPGRPAELLTNRSCSTAESGAGIKGKATE